MTSALDRVQLIEGSPPCMPGKCVICGTTGDSTTKFLDIGLEIEFYGVVYFCTTCLSGNILPHLDLVPLDMLLKAEEELEEAKATVTELDVQNSELRSVIESLGKLGFSSNVLGPDSSAESNVAAVPETEQPKPATTNRKSTSRKTGSTKQTDESGSTSIFNTDDIAKKYEL